MLSLPYEHDNHDYDQRHPQLLHHQHHPNPLQMSYMSVKLDFPYYKDDTLEIFSLPYEHDQLNEEISEAHMFLMR